MNERQWSSSVFPIDQEIGIQRQDRVPFMDFCHSDNACVRQRHGCVPVFVQQAPQFVGVLPDVESDLNRSVPKEIK